METLAGWALTTLVGIVFGGLAVGVIWAIIYIAYLTFKMIIDWFSSKANLLASNKNYSAVTIRHILENGKQGLVQGILNKASNELVEVQIIEYDKLDDQLAALHNQYDVVTYS